ncbi:catecholate siderophore receptor CirA [Chryseobacterium gleum]|uniref:Catecholate siderophore receptor CirA n=2 Tax=Chryseobacterium gleum TaxID=250 RepID=A0A3S4PBK2_CHRGE|nr:TonB-dependent receptor [Chryseobacterium gleum]EFK35358.1 TonB-dependent receptor plug domain protein [Chryseobacterium gleum ATCC 35910]QQY31136.1 TonB-dependent receptor [Chryseobacterium gleum]VEE04484.1 catecholate siderophore receptor CirA [Chryseobacterium gleum]
MKNKTEIVTIFTRKTLGLTLVLSAAALAFAQEKAGVSGTIVNKKNQPVPYASVTFSNKTNKTLSDAVLTDEKGQYKIQLMPGDYEITVEAIDYKKSVVSKNIAAAGNIGALSIEAEPTSTVDGKTKEIQGVVITASAAKPYKVELDKKTYDPSQDIVSKGGTLQDVLTNVPSVSVDTDGTVSMRGSSNVKFLINGKPSALLGIDDGANALQSIPADQIDRIEVITNPSSKFEASGTAGILNIILKKNKKTGFNGSVTGTLGYLPQTSLNTNLSWRKGKFTWFLNGGGGYRESKNTSRNDAWFNSGINKETHNESISKNKNDNYNATGGLTYDISDKTSVNASGTVRTFDSDNTGNINYFDYPFSGGNIFRQRASIGTGNNLAFQGDFGLDHKFDDNGQNLSVSLSLQRNRSNNDNDINDTTNGIFQLQDLVNQSTLNKSIIAKADYELPIGENSKIEAGYRLDHNDNDYSNVVRQRPALNPALVYLDKYTYNANYKEMFNAFYLQFKSKIGKLGYQIGLRDELSKVDVDYLNREGTAVNKSKTYNNLFPSVFLSYEIAKDNQFLVNYSRRIDRPRSFFLIPNPNYNDNQNLFDGNIDLNPSYVDSYEIGYSISKKNFTINPTVYYRHTTDDVKMLVYDENVAYTDANGNPQTLVAFHTKPINLGTDDRYGLDLNFNWDATKWLKFLGNVDLFGYKTTGTYFDPEIMEKPAPFEGSGFSTRARLTSTFKIDKTLNFQLQGFYRGGQKTASIDRRDMYALNFGASKTIWNGNGTISFNIQDIFNTRSMRSTAYGPNYTRDSYMQWQPRQFALSFTYRFKQGEKIEQPKKKKDINSNATGDDQQGGPM